MRDSPDKDVQKYLYHLIVLQGFPDGGLFFRRALGDDGICLFRVIVAFPDGEAAFALDLGDIEARDLEAEVRFHEGFELVVGRSSLRGGEREVLCVQIHGDLIVRPALAQKYDA